MKTALITGVSGQDGCYLAKLLINKGYKVVGTLRSKALLNLKKFEYVGISKEIILEEIDLWDITDIIRTFDKYQPDEIYNLAAQSSVGLSFNQPIGTFNFNTASVNNLLEAVRLYNPQCKFYQASSSEMYGKTEVLPITLNSPMNPLSPYAVSKMAAYKMSEIYRNSYNLFVCNGILFNHESVLRNNNFFIKKVIRGAIRILEGQQKNLQVGNLNINRDFGYAPRYVEAIWLMMQQDEAKDYIICSGISIQLREIVHYVFNKLNLDKQLIVEDKSLFRPNEITEIYGDNSLAKKALGWNYNISFFNILDILIEEEYKFRQF